MNLGNFKNLVATAATGICVLGFAAGSARAGELYNGWNYAIDSFKDGTEGTVIGVNSDYEFYGMAIKEDAATNSIFVALNANLPIGGASDNGAADKNIGWGDMIFNFSGQNLETANANGNLFGVRFASTNDSGVGVGVYGNVTAKSVAKENSGYKNLTAHKNAVTSYGGTATLGDLAQTDPYFKQNGDWTVLNSIKSGDYLGGVNLLSNLSGLGLDFGHFNATGSHTIGFSFDKSLMPVGEFVAHLFAECANDGMAIEGSLQAVVPPIDETEVPEPTTTAALAIFGLTFVGSQLKKNKAIA